MKKKVIAFDLDGTLVDSNNIHLKAHMYAAKKLRLKISKKNMEEIFLLTTKGVLKKYFPDMKKEEIDRFIKIEQEHLSKIIKKVKPFPGVIEALEKLKLNHKIIIISNTNYEFILKTLEAANLNPMFFDLIVGADLVENSKPKPDEFFKARKILHHNVDYFVGDTIVDMQAGKNAKTKTIGVTTGFNTKKELEQYKPYVIISKIEQLTKLI
jgi:HAD superfamily hydrolase (TIGR01549 family)